MSDIERDKAAIAVAMKCAKTVIERHYSTTLEFAPNAKVDLLGCDFNGLDGKPPLIAVRLRRHSAYERWPDQFTVRSFRDGAKTTEYDRIVTDNAYSLYVYGFMTADEKGLVKLTGISIDQTNKHAVDLITNCRGGEKDNRDGTRFSPYDVADAFERNLVEFQWENGEFTYPKPKSS